MSQYQPPNWDQAGYDPSHPYYRPPRRAVGPVVVVLLVLGVLGLLFVGAVVAMVAVVARMEANMPAGYGDLEATNPPHVHDWAAVRAGYDADAPRPNLRQLARLQALVDEYVRCANEDDDAGLQKIVDYSRFYREMKATRFANDVTLFDRRALMSSLVDGVHGIAGWERIAITGIQPLPGRGEVIVYGHGHHASSHTNPVRLWVADGRTPKLFDWELLEYGVRETGDWSIICAYDNDPRLDEYRQGMLEVEAAKELWHQDEVQQAHEKLRAAERRRVPPPYRDGFLLKLAYTWLNWEQYDQALGLIARIQDKDALPGAYFVEAQAVQSRSDWPQCLELLKSYEGQVGQTIASLRMKADVCQSLERWDEAAQHRRALLKIAPDDVEAIDEWASALREDDLHQLAEHVATLPDPVATATDLATRFSYRDDVEAVRVLAELVDERSPNSNAATQLAALAHYAGNEYKEAAPLFLKVFKAASDDDQRETARYRYLECMLSSDQALAAYDESESPAEDFLYFAEDYDYGDGYLSAEQMQQLVEAHLKRVPDDPWGYYYASFVGEEEKGADALEQLVRQGMKLAKDADDEDTAAAMQDRLLYVMYQSGRAVEAYDTISPGEETFHQLAGYFRYSDERPVEELDALIEKHQAAHRDDPWIGFYRALAAEKRDLLVESDAQLRAAHRRASAAVENQSDLDVDDYEIDGDEALLNSIAQMWINQRLAAGRAMDAYRDIPPPEETFATLATRLHADADWNTLERLIQAHQARHSDDPQLLYWQAQLAAGREQHDEVARLLHPWPTQADALESWNQATLRELLVTSLLKANRPDDARAAAQHIRDAGGGVLSLIKVGVVAGDVVEAKRLLEELRNSPYILKSVYNDEEIRDALLAEAYFDLRRRAPPGLGYANYGYGRAVLLQVAPQSIAPQRLREAAGEVLAGDVTVDAVKSDAAAVSPDGFVLTGDAARIAVWFGAGKYEKDAEFAARKLADKDLLSRWGKHSGWVSLHVLEPRDAKEAGYLVHRLTARLIDDNVTAVHVPGWLLPATEEVRLRLISGENVTDDDEMGAATWLYHEPPESDDQQQWLQARPGRLRELDRAFAGRKPEQAFDIQITQRAGDGCERHWLKLVRVERSGYRDRSFVGQFTTDSALRPRFKAGEYVHVMPYEIDNWRIVDGEQTTLARP